MNKKPRRPCQACHADEATHGVEQWPEEFFKYCEACGRAMVTVIWDAYGRKADIVELETLPVGEEVVLPQAKTKPSTINIAPVVVTPKKRGRPPKVRPVVELAPLPVVPPPPPPVVSPPLAPKKPEDEGGTTMDDLLGM